MKQEKKFSREVFLEVRGKNLEKSWKIFLLNLKIFDLKIFETFLLRNLINFHQKFTLFPKIYIFY